MFILKEKMMSWEDITRFKLINAVTDLDFPKVELQKKPRLESVMFVYHKGSQSNPANSSLFLNCIEKTGLSEKIKTIIVKLHHWARLFKARIS